jgi:hypothetical protein
MQGNLTFRGGMRTASAALTLAFFASALSATALADDVLPGFDLFETDPTTTYQDFAGTPVPADFFGPGSDPFDGVIQLMGVPLGSYPGCPYDSLGNTDTIVERSARAVLPGPPSQDTVSIELVALHLHSISPVTVTYNGGMDPEHWDMEVGPSPTLPSVGTMTIRHENAQGGTFDSELLVYAIFTFTKVSDPVEVRVLDGGLYGLNTHFMATDVPWIHATPPEGSCTSNFCVNPGKVTVEEAEWAAHGILSICPGVSAGVRPGAVWLKSWGAIKSLYR